MFAVESLSFGVSTPVVPTAFCDCVGDEPLSPSEPKRARAIAKIIERLPEAGSVVIVHSPTVVAAWRRLILDGRGSAVAVSTRVLAAPALRDECSLTAGLTVPVYRDPFVDEAREHRRAIAQAWRL